MVHVTISLFSPQIGQCLAPESDCLRGQKEGRGILSGCWGTWG